MLFGVGTKQNRVAAAMEGEKKKKMKKRRKEENEGRLGTKVTYPDIMGRGADTIWPHEGAM